MFHRFQPALSRSVSFRWLLAQLACALLVAAGTPAGTRAHDDHLEGHLPEGPLASLTVPAPRGRTPRTVPPIAVTRESAFPALGPISIGGVSYFPYRFEGHVHTAHSPDARHSTVEILGAAERMGLDALIFTDHGDSSARFDFPAYRGAAVPFVGREIAGAFGHAVIWNVTDDTRQIPSRTTLAERARFAHEHGGLLVFAHPGWWIDGNRADPMEWMTPQAMQRGGVAGEVDAIELWNGVYHTPLAQLIAAWVSLLESGVYVPIVGNSDFHRADFHRLGNAHNIAFCDRPELATCLWPAVREGRIVVTDGPLAVLSVNEQLPGAVVNPAGAPLRVAVEALAPEGGTLRVYLGKAVVATLALAAGAQMIGSWEVPAPQADSYVRIDIERPARTRAQPPVSLLSNPVRIDVGTPRAAWR